MASGKKLGEIVRPFFEKMGAEVKHGPGVVAYTVTMEQLNNYFENDPFGKMVAKMWERATPLSELLAEAKKRGP